VLPSKDWTILNGDTNRRIIDVILNNRKLPLDHMQPFRLTDRMHDPQLLPDMDKAVERIIRAVKENEKIVIFGDYDVDGVTSTALMIYFFKAINYPVRYIVPNRERDGYGLRVAGIDTVNSWGGDLIITVDNGISANEAIDYGNSLGIETVITDHHLQEGELPDAVAVVNPNRTDSEYPFKQICGVTVAFKLLHALAPHFMSEDNYKQFLLSHLDLVAIGTIADVMPLRDENYALVKFGLKVLANTKKPGLIALKQVASIRTNTITPITIGYFLAPRLNAAGRMEDAGLSVDLLIESNMHRAETMASQLDELNRERQTLQETYIQNALAGIDGEADANKVIIIENEEWQAGLIGLVSGKLKEKFSRPVIAFTRDEQGNFVGSARSIEAFHVTEALTRFNHYFLNYGGHHKAAGLTVTAENYPRFKQEFTEYVNKFLENENLTAELIIDSVVDLSQVNEVTARQIQEVGPFGETSPEPVLLLTDVLVREIRTLGREQNHLKLFVQKENKLFECVWWGGAEYKDAIRLGAALDLAFKMNINIFRGTSRLQLNLEDVRINN